MSVFGRLPLGRVPEIEAADLKTRLDQYESVQLIDVRTASESDELDDHLAPMSDIPFAFVVGQYRTTL